MTTIALRFAPPRSHAVPRAAFDLGAMFAGAVLVAVLAQFRIDIGVVPITGQTLGVLLVGASLGPALGAGSMLLYLALGVAGLPVFAPFPDGSHATGWQALGLVAPTAGYLFGFVAAAAVTGALARRGWDRSFGSSLGAMLIGNVVIYLFGIPWLMQALDWDLSRALAAGLTPFIIGDTLKLFAAAALLPAAWHAVDRFRPEDDAG
jgi:biotin transport system substrate-specific component